MGVNVWRACLFFAAFGLLLMSGCRPAPYPKGQPGSPAPDFTLNAALGGSYQLADLQGRMVLLSFIDAEAQLAENPNQTAAAHLEVLRDFHTRYHRQGIEVLIFDAAAPKRGRAHSAQSMLDLTRAWDLESIPLLYEEGAGGTVEAYGVRAFPTTFLISAEGSIQQRWEGQVTAAQLAAEAAPLVSASLPGGLPVSGLPEGDAAYCPRQSTPQAGLGGMSGAHALSNEIWMVDDGMTWDSGGAFSLHWIVFDPLGIAGSLPEGEDGLRLTVTAVYVDDQSEVTLVDEAMHRLPEMEKRQLAAKSASLRETASGAALPEIYQLAVPVTLSRPGCLRLAARVSAEGAQAAYQGELVVRVKER